MVLRTRHMTPPSVDPRRPGLVWPVAIDPAGITGPTPAQARGPAWVAGPRGLHLPAGLDPSNSTDQRIVTGAALLPPGGAVTGWAALRWAGARHLDGWRGRVELPVALAVPRPPIRARAGIDVTTQAALLDRVVEVDGLTLSPHAGSVAYAVRCALSLDEAVALIDRACAADLVSLAEMTQWADRSGGGRWVSRLRTAIGLAEENCWSPKETTLRLVCQRLALGELVCNRPVFDLAGSHLGTPDLLAVDVGLVLEYDSLLHLDAARRGVDVNREAVFRRAGLEYVEMVTADLRDPTDFRRRTLDARERARLMNAERRWTLTPPPRWVETHTVDRRRALTAYERMRFLRWQAG
ncbi:hypothetical protein FHP29_01215 [Nocardioides albidus]|uniref:AbiEi antitoxin C-terminal domain-containing protein n=1 Tax=Nocardioides albidus TaxID=1517589 RepID=A0A5C4WMG8_9ACTN|nr:hypothetical protein [Nocardioides albidus]TNM49504.1 hypothetical protein FHP29_01215 [Nocardioides albidus]